MADRTIQEKIDFIVYWVDGNDLEWRAKKNKYAVSAGQDVSDNRYRDWDNLQYLFRGIEAFAPWVNRVFFISDNQVPAWLNLEHPKLKLVDHRDYIPMEYLPTFSANPIELNFHRIKDLSEHFVVFNDDFFLTNTVTPNDFFRNGKPVDIFIEFPILFNGGSPVFSHLLVNDFHTIAKYYKRDEYKKRLRSMILSPKYGAYFFYNLVMYMLPFHSFFGMQTPHFCRPYLKSSIEKVWEIEGELLDSVSRNRFRSPDDVNIYLFRIFNMLEGNFVPENIYKMGKGYGITEENDRVCLDIMKKRYKMICINDNCDEAVFKIMKDKVNRSFHQILPDKCSFEK